MKMPGTAAGLLLSWLVLAGQAQAQCELQQLSNPSFEVGSGNLMAGWNQFGSVAASTSLTSHGLRAVALSGPNSGDWGLSAVWQKQTSAPGDSWEVRADVGHSAGSALNGANISLIVNIEWRDAADALISYDSFPVLTQASPTGVSQPVTVTSTSAPAGTVSMHLLIGLLQSPAQETGTAVVDNVFLRRVNGVQQEDFQFDDFPGGRVIQFAGRDWRVKGPGYYGPGPSLFSDTNSTVWLDAQDQLHMKIRRQGAVWYSSEIMSDEVLGYGDYRLTLKGRLDNWADNVVFGFFHWTYPWCYDGGNPWNLHNELDVEISRWEDPNRENAQFIVQPWWAAGAASLFDISTAGDETLTTIAYRWLADRVEYRAWAGPADAEASSPLIHSWVYTGPYLPRVDHTRMHFNLWQLNGPPDNLQEHEVTITDFVFEAQGDTPVVVPVPLPGWVLGLLGLTIIVLVAKRKLS